MVKFSKQSYSHWRKGHGGLVMIRAKNPIICYGEFDLDDSRDFKEMLRVVKNYIKPSGMNSLTGHSFGGFVQHLTQGGVGMNVVSNFSRSELHLLG